MSPGPDMGGDGAAALASTPEIAPAAAAFRVCTAFGTVLYVDPLHGELRHGAVEHSPLDTPLLVNSHPGVSNARGILVHDVEGAQRPIVRMSGSIVLGTRAAGSRDAGEAGVEFEIVTTDDGRAGLRANGLYICAEADGRITHSRDECLSWERFTLVDAGTDINRLKQIAESSATTAGLPGWLSHFHLGCGGAYVPGYLNLDIHADETDIQPGLLYSDFKGFKGAYFLRADLTLGLPGVDNSLDVIYHCHFLDHLTYRDAIGLLQQSRCRLKPGGIMRLAVPDLELWIRNYYWSEKRFFEGYRKLALGDDAGLYPTKGSIFMGMMHNFGHRCGYDFETLKALLDDAGFVNIRRTRFQESSIPEIKALEPYTSLRAIESLCIECEKPLAGSAAAITVE